MSIPEVMPLKTNSTSSAQPTSVSRKSAIRQLIAVMVANALEFFDFTVYTYFSVMIGKTFFPSYAPNGQLLMAVGVFGLGFVARPLGAFIIGTYADRAGRRAAMTLTFKMMFVGTALLACTPSYATIGIAAPILILLARLIQGFSAGGEAGPSTTYLLESAGIKRRGLYTSLQLATQGAAAIMAGSIGYLLSITMSPADLESWGWRIPFLLGLLVYPAGIYLRSTLSETLLASEAHGDTRAIFSQIRQHHLGNLLAAIGTMIGPTVTAYVAGHYMTTYGIHVLHFPASISMLAGLVGGTAAVLAALAAGLIFDRFPRMWLMVLPQIILMLAVYPVFLWITQTGSPGIFFSAIVIMTVLRVSGAPLQLVYIPETFPPAVRATCLSICYALAISVFGGATQFIVTWLLNVTHDPMAPSWYLVFANVLSVIALLILVLRRRRQAAG